MDIDDSILQTFRRALVADDEVSLERLLASHPDLVDVPPQSDQPASALEIVAAECSRKRPQKFRLAEMLVRHGASYEITTVARAGLIDAVAELLVDDPGAINARDVLGRSALYRAACVPDRFDEGVEVAEYLIARGAIVDVFTACTLGMLDRVRVVLDNDGRLARTPDPGGASALHWAARPRRAEEHAAAIAGALVDYGAAVDAVDSAVDGAQALHHACAWGAPPALVELLLERGAEANARDGAGRTPLDHAIANGHEQLVGPLESRGAVRADPAAHG